MKEVLQKDYYRQMVGEMLYLDDYQDGMQLSLFISALWGNPGGLAVFDGTRKLYEMNHTASAELARANRVTLMPLGRSGNTHCKHKTSSNQLALLPLEQGTIFPCSFVFQFLIDLFGALTDNHRILIRFFRRYFLIFNNLHVSIYDVTDII